MNWEAVFLENLSLIDSVTRFVCRKHGLIGADAEDFSATVRLKLIEDDYAILRSFKQEASLSTYLTVVIRRLYLDQKIHEWGKWRPSMRARQQGDAAVLLERLVSRDGMPLAEASGFVRQQFPELDARQVEALAASIVVRQPRRTLTVERTEEMPEPVSHTSADDPLLAGEREAAARRTSEIVNRELARLPPEDRLIMKLKYIDAVQVSTIARMLQADQKQLYRRIEKLVATLRQALLAAGVAMTDIGDMLTSGADALSFNLGDPPPEGRT
jgi:RNA polymerase sigma factor (sigma-70 family)